jgi:hypothetical protein
MLQAPFEGENAPLGVVTEGETPFPGMEQLSNGIHADLERRRSTRGFPRSGCNNGDMGIKEIGR